MTLADSDIATLRRLLQDRLPAEVALLRRMVEINSWTTNRAGVNEVGRLTAAAFAELGFSAESVPSENPAWGDHLIMQRGGTGRKTIALVSHLDTVFPPEEEERNEFRWRREGDRVYGPGTSDIKGGTVLMHLMLHGLRETNPTLFEELNWLLLWNASEETLSEHFGRICRDRLDNDTLATLVFEAEGTSDGPRRLVTSRKGRLTFRLRVRGRGAHAGSDHPRGANAVVQLSRTIQRIADLTDYRQALTFNVGLVSGGTGFNRVPHEAVAEGEMRAFDSVVYARGKDALMALGGQGEIRSPEDNHACSVAIEIMEQSPPWPANPGTEALFEIWRDTGADLGMSIEPEARGGMSDGNVLWEAAPTLDGLGPVGDNSHCSETNEAEGKSPEFVDLDSFVPKAMLNIAGIERLVRG